MNRSMLALALFFVVWPIVTGLSLTLEATGIPLPMAARTFVTSVILVPAMVYAIVPVLTRVLARRV